MECVPNVIVGNLVVGTTKCEDVDVRRLATADALEAKHLIVAMGRQRWVTRECESESFPEVRPSQQIRALAIEAQGLVICSSAEGARAGCAGEVIGTSCVSYDGALSRVLLRDDVRAMKDGNAILTYHDRSKNDLVRFVNLRRGALYA